MPEPLNPFEEALEVPPNAIIDFHPREPSAVNEPRPLFNGRKPLYELKSESPRHRAIIMMSAAGMGNKEIADTLGMTAQHVMYVKKQPWAVQQILTEIESAGREPVFALLRDAAMGAAERLVEIAVNAKNDETKRKANNDILDRVFGKSTNVVSVTSSKATEMSDDELVVIAKRNIKN